MAFSLASLLERHARERKQADPAQRHLGSIFKDPPKTTAHTLLAQTGVAGKTSGNAHISEYNTNYIVNLEGASAAAIASLMVQTHQMVLAQQGIHYNTFDGVLTQLLVLAHPDVEYLRLAYASEGGVHLVQVAVLRRPLHIASK